MSVIDGFQQQPGLAGGVLEYGWHPIKKPVRRQR